MKALTIWQPWATLVAEGAKPYEFRGWHPPDALIGQRIAIHASARKPDRQEMLKLLYDLERGDRGSRLVADIAIRLLNTALSNPTVLPLSAVVCTAILGKPLTPSVVKGWANDSERNAHFNFAWPLTDIQRFTPPIPARGAQGFWNWTPPT